jgi:predicted flap endonuclease-1-like 5' DNA nuclease
VPPPPPRRPGAATPPPGSPQAPPATDAAPRSVQRPSFAPRASTPPAGDSEVDHARRVLASKLIELKSLETERERLLARISERDRRIHELEAQLGSAAQAEARACALDERLAQREADLARLEQQLSEALSRTPSVEDDLTKIRGIGPKFATMLRELGVNRYAQIADWTEQDVREFADKLRVPPSRIQKAGWIASARTLAGR